MDTIVKYSALILPTLISDIVYVSFCNKIPRYINSLMKSYEEVISD